jgi:rod shape-determining protein MreD
MGPLSLRVAGACVFALAAWGVVGVELAPGLSSPMPDLMFCVAALWSIRRPAAAPLTLLFALALARDLVSGAPAGLGALAFVLVCAALRRNSAALRRRAFPVEWLTAATAAALMLTAQQALLIVTLAPTPSLDDLGLRFGATALAYPAVALIFRWAARVGPPNATADGELMFERRIP